MSEFKLDTSGRVRPLGTDAIGTDSLIWSDLSPFEQGYVEAMFASESDNLADQARENAAREDETIDLEDQPEAWRDAYRPGFSDLAPETLAAIRKDCAAHQNGPTAWINTAVAGSVWFSDRQKGCWKDFPRLTVTLGEDGKVVFS